MSDSSANPVHGLPALEQRFRQDMSWLCLPAKPWAVPRAIDGEPVQDVAIVGGGMGGLAAAFAMQNLGLNAAIYDRAPAGLEGPWATTARMETLRSPKELTGPALGFAALTFRAWFEAQFGLDAWAALDKIPRLQWMDYLRWYRKVTGVVVHNAHHVRSVQPRADHVELSMDSPAGSTGVRARHVVLATGRDGLGGPIIPDFLKTLERKHWAHSSDPMDYGQLAGLRVGVIGAGASAMDSAATALEAGAREVQLLIRSHELPRINKGKGAGNPGFNHGFAALPDAWKWRYRHYLNVARTPPPHHSVLRVSRHDNAHFNLGCPIRAIAWRDGALQVHTPQRHFELDFIIAGTGFDIDWLQRPELAPFAGHVRTWGERFEAPADEADASLAGHPDLGTCFEFQPKPGHDLPGLDRIHCLNFAAVLSQGAISGDIPAVSIGAQRLAECLTARLYAEDVAVHYQRMQDFSEPELLGDEWTPAPTALHANLTS